MARLLLNAEDLTRVRIAPVPDPFTETLSAAALIRHQPASPVFGWWRRSLQGKLAQVRPLAAIMPAGRPGLDLRTLVGPVGTVSEGAEALRGIRRQHLHDEIEWLYRNYPHAPGPWMRLDSDLPLRRLLGSAICSFHAAAVSPHWPQIYNFLQAERAHQIQRMATAGVEAFLAGLCPPMIQWHPPVLRIRTSDTVPEITENLGGRGLVIVPSVFSVSPTLTADLRDGDLAPQLTYPVVRELGTVRQLWACPRDGQALAALLGRTRSAALEVIAEGCGTGELAARIGISPAAASQHASVLRRAGLITTRRHGGSVLHTVTSLGARLLDGDG
jgi:Helix-turn-helix domain